MGWKGGDQERFSNGVYRFAENSTFKPFRGRPPIGVVINHSEKIVFVDGRDWF